MKRFPVTAIFFAACLPFLPALAAETSVTVTGVAPVGNGGYQQKAARISYGDLDLSSHDGAAVLLQRIDRASRLVCGEGVGLMRTTESRKSFEQCRSTAAAAAIRSVNATAVTQLAARP